MESELSLKETQKEWHGTFKAYMMGFFASLLLTGASFLLVYTRLLPKEILPPTLICLALIQALFQLRFFLHVGQEAKPRWEMLTLYFTVLVLLIVALGSLWIMYDLNLRMMPEMKMEMPHD
jgi:cytochrome o ubiquinol oxidase subunit IV